MREVMVGDEVMRLKGSPLSLLYYQQEFDGRDFFGDFMKWAVSLFGADVLKGGADVTAESANLANFDTVLLLRIAWTLNRTAAGPYARDFPPFEAWVAENEDFDVFDREVMKIVMDEAKKAFFRSRAAGVAPAARK